jgi:hypothetical protein
MRVLTFLAITLTAIIVWSAWTQASMVKQDRCIGFQEVMTQIEARSPQTTIQLLYRPRARAYIQEISKTLSHRGLKEPDSLLIATHPQAQTSVFILGFRHGCQIGHLQVDINTHRKIMVSITRQEI